MMGIIPLAINYQVNAGEWYYQPIFSSQIEADDNKRLRSQDEQGVVGANARVDIKLSNVTEISELYVRGALRSVRYDGDDERAVDTDDQLLYAGGRWSGERSQLSVDGEYTRQSSQFTELQDTGFLEDVNRRVDRRINTQYIYTLTEKTQVFVGGNYSDVEFPNSIPVTLTEYNVEGINTGVVYTFDERNSVTFTAFHSDYEAESFTSDVETNGSNLRYDRVIDEMWTGYVGAGYRKSNFKNIRSGMLNRDDDTGSSFELGVSRIAERSRFNLDASNSLEPSADGDVNERTELTISYNRSFSDRFSSRLFLDWFDDESVNNDEEEEREYWTATLSADYRLTPQWSLTGTVRHREQDIDSSINGRDAKSDAVIIGIRYTGANKRISKL